MRMPYSWELVRLSDVCRINPRLEPSEKPDDKLPVSFVRMSAVDEVFGQIVNPETRPYNEVSKGFTTFKEGDVLFAKITPCMENGKAAIAKGLVNGIGFGSTEFHVLRPSEFLAPEYLFFFIRQQAFRERARAAFIGSAGQQRVPPDFMERVKIPLPTTLEQEFIVKILKHTEDLFKLRYGTVKCAGGLYSSLFLEMFGDPVRNPKGYKKAPLEKLGQLDRGVSKHRPRDASFLFGGKYPFIQTGDVANSGGWITTYTQTYSEEGLAQSRLWPSGTLCITIAANIARAGILTFDACFPDSVVGFLPNESVTTEYVMFALSFFQTMLEAQAPQAAQKNVNLQILNALRITVPPKESQEKFSSIANNIRESIQCLEDSSRKLDDLFAELTLEGFTGELTAIWRESHRRDLEDAVRVRDKALRMPGAKLAVREYAPEERPWQFQQERLWLKNQLSELQGHVWKAMQEWKGTLVPSEDMAGFKEKWPIEHLENADDQILRALNQLAGLGLLAKIAVSNSEGEYVTAFRGMREEEFSRSEDIEALSKMRG